MWEESAPGEELIRLENTLCVSDHTGKIGRIFNAGSVCVCVCVCIYMCVCVFVCVVEVHAGRARGRKNGEDEMGQQVDQITKNSGDARNKTPIKVTYQILGK